MARSPTEAVGPRTVADVQISRNLDGWVAVVVDDRMQAALAVDQRPGIPRPDRCRRVYSELSILSINANELSASDCECPASSSHLMPCH